MGECAVTFITLGATVTVTHISLLSQTFCDSRIVSLYCVRLFVAQDSYDFIIRLFVTQDAYVRILSDHLSKITLAGQPETLFGRWYVQLAAMCYMFNS